MGIKWKWGAEPLNKGKEGFNDAGILTFNSHAINSLVRELFQNSNDAKVKNTRKVIIKIEYRDISKTEIPAFDQYVQLLKKVEKSNPQQIKFFKKAYASLSNDKIPFLIYSDSNTLGLSGTEKDDNSSFLACVLSDGISAKESKSAGGSFGIGKNAIYGISNLRTIFYSSLTPKNEIIFQGVAKLASYKEKNINHASRIYLGSGNERLAVRRASEIPRAFKRTEPGLSQFVMGVDLDENWHLDVSKAVLRNYWCLLLHDGLEVEILKNGKSLLKINSSNVVSQIETLFKNDDDSSSLEPYGNPYLFYEAYADGMKTQFEVPHINNCTFHYIESERAENNIAYLRNGMVVYSRIEKRLVGANVTGVFKCDTEEGNEILRLMEPPKHDSFEPQMLEDKHDTLVKKHGEKIVSSIKNEIRSVIKSLIDKYKKETETPLFLTELFEDLQKGIANGSKGERKNDHSGSETLYKRAVDDTIIVNLLSDSDNSYISSRNGNLTLVGAGGGEGTGSNGTGSNKKTNRKPSRGGSKNHGSTNKSKISSRIFYWDTLNNHNTYKAVLFSETAIDNAEARIYQMADSGEEIAFTLHKIYDDNKNEIAFIEEKDIDGAILSYKVPGLNIPSDGRSIFLEVSEFQKSSFIIKG
jgi:hypothetical protein